MKKVILSITAFAALFFTACEKETLTDATTTDVAALTTTSTTTNEDAIIQALIVGDNDPQALGKLKKIKLSDLSSVITDYINATYKGATAVGAFKDKDGNTIVIVKDAEGNTKALVFDAEGKFVKETTLPTKGNGGADATVISTIKNYLTENYKDGKIGHISKNKEGGFSVIVRKSDGTVVVVTFDKDGKFVSETNKSDNGGSTGDSEIITTIKDYLNTTYPGATFSPIGKDKEGNFVVRVKTADGKSLIVTFDKSGKFLDEKLAPVGGNSVPLPSNITKYITDNYPSGKVVGKPRIDKDGNFIVTVVTQEGTYDLFFDKDGNFVKAVKKK